MSIHKDYAPDLVAGGAVRDALGRVIHEHYKGTLEVSEDIINLKEKVNQLDIEKQDNVPFTYEPTERNKVVVESDIAVCKLEYTNLTANNTAAIINTNKQLFELKDKVDNISTTENSVIISHPSKQNYDDVDISNILNIN